MKSLKAATVRRPFSPSSKLADVGKARAAKLRVFPDASRSGLGEGRSRTLALVLSAMAGLGVLGLTGCGVSGDELSASAAAVVPAGTITGHVHGGVFPIRNATITLMQTVTSSTSGYGSAALSLATASSDQNGYFTFSDTVKCAANEFAYIVVTSGNTTNLGTSTNNNSVVQVGVIGACSLFSSTTAEDNINVFVSELSTVAAGYALGNFMTVTDANDYSGKQVVNIGAPANNSTKAACTGTGTAMTCTAAGLAHGFKNAFTLVDSVRTNGTFPTGMANSYNSLASSSIPAPLINTIGNILQQCVDSVTTATPSPSAACSSLFAAAKPPSGTAPVDTLQVVLDMAKYPTNNVGTLFGQTAPTVPFTPYLSSAPTSFALSIFYGVTVNGSSIPYPVDIALDLSDNAYVLYGQGAPGTTANTSTAVNEWNASGQLTLAGTQNTTYLYPNQLAIDASSNVYVSNNDPTATNDVVLRLSGGKLYPVATLTGASGLAVDNSNNVFASSVNTATASMTEYTSAAMATALTTSIAGSGTVFTAATALSASSALGATAGLAIDSSGNIWGAGLSGTTAAAFLWPLTTSKTTPYAASTGLSTPFTQTSPFSVAINGGNTAYFPLDGALSSATYASSTLTTNSSVAAAASAAVPHRSQADGAGNVFWTDLENTGQLYMYSPGATTPVIGLVPCFVYPVGSTYNCITTTNQTSSNSVYTPANFRALAIDSAGNIWYAADAGYGAIVETLGLAAPTWPLLAYEHPGVKPK